MITIDGSPSVGVSVICESSGLLSSGVGIDVRSSAALDRHV